MLNLFSAAAGLLLLGLISQPTTAQKLRVGLTGAISRQYLNVFTFSNSTRGASADAHGLQAYLLGAKALYHLTPHWQLVGELRFQRVKVDASISQVDLPSTYSSITWQGRGGFGQLPLGITYCLKPRAKVAPIASLKGVVGGGLVMFDQTSLTLGAYEGPNGYQMPRSVSVRLTDLTEYPVQVQFGLEGAVGVRLTKGIELNALYYYSFSKLTPVTYTYEVDQETQDGQFFSSRNDGFIRGRPTHIAGEMVVYFN